MKEFVKKILERVPLQNVIVFSSLNDFDCNAGALFQYLIAHGYDKKYTMVWNTIREDSGKEYATNPKVKVYHENSRSILKRYYYYVAKYFIWDNHPITKKRADQLSIYSTHGVPPLKTTRGKISIDNVADFALCPSAASREWESREYAVNINKLFICDQPRNDYLFRPAKGYLNPLKTQISNYTKTVLWMPTFRTRQNGENDSTAEYYMGIPLIQDREDLEQLNRHLMEKGILLIIKLHPQQLITNESTSDMKNIYFMRDNSLDGKSFDINEVMVETDAMLTDYSTVIWDYLLLDRPIGFTIPDINEYCIGFAVNDPLRYMPGKKIYEKRELYDFFANLLSGKDEYTEERRVICKEMHDFTDDKNCERFLKKFRII